jgi:hypothetical protein
MAQSPRTPIYGQVITKENVYARLTVASVIAASDLRRSLMGLEIW